jgi:serine/threonine protein kinase
VRLVDGARVTRADQVVGTAAYLAPEQVRGGEITPAVDVYALGLVLLECLSGHREYEGAEIEAAVARLHRPPVVPDDLPFGFRRLLTLMTSLSAARRPTAGECAKALLANETQVLAAPRRSRGLLAAASAAVLIAAAGTGILAQNRDAPAESAPPATTAPVSTQPSTTVQTQVPAPVAEQPVAETTVQPPVQVQQNGKSGKGKGKGKGKGP